MYSKLITGFKENLIFDLILQEREFPFYLEYIILSLVFFKYGDDKEMKLDRTE